MSSTSKLIDTAKFSERLRARAVDPNGKRLLVSSLAGSQQEVDISEPLNCEGYGRVRHFRSTTADGWPSNPLPISPASKALGIQPVPPMIRAQVFQNAACGWRCWYCFVPYSLLSADSKRSRWMTAEELIGLYTKETDRPVVIDLSGGSPDLVPEWIVWTMDALDKAGLADSTYLWSDDNLSTNYLFEKLEPQMLQRLGAYKNYGRVCCFKGFDSQSFSFNTNAQASDYDSQFETMRRLLALGIDLYCYVTLTSPSEDNIRNKISIFMDRLQQLHPNLPLRTVPLRIRVFSPVNDRLTDPRRLSMVVQEQAILAWNDEIRVRYHDDLRALDISDVPLR